jgi:uncharacterized protein
MSMNLSSKDDVLQALRLMKDGLHADYGVTRIGVFGSVARGEAGDDSDVDVVVEMAPNLFARAALKQALEARLGRPVDVIRYRQTMNRRLKRRIDREALYV